MSGTPKLSWRFRILDGLARFGACSVWTVLILATIVFIFGDIAVAGISSARIHALAVTVLPMTLVAGLVLGLLAGLPPLRALARRNVLTRAIGAALMGGITFAVSLMLWERTYADVMHTAAGDGTERVLLYALSAVPALLAAAIAWGLTRPLPPQEPLPSLAPRRPPEAWRP